MTTKPYYIANNITVDPRFVVEVKDNGETGDRKRTIWREAGTEKIWIETNGNPEVYETLTEAEANL